MTKAELVALLRQYARKYGIDEAIAIAQIQQESGFNPGAGSPAGAQGIAQFIPATARRFGVNVWDVNSSFDGWGRYMRLMLDMFGGRYDLALAGYNSGENRAEYRNAAAAGRAINWSVLPAGVQSETRHYVNKILGGSSSYLGVVADPIGNLEEALPGLDSLAVGGFTVGAIAIGGAALILVLILVSD